MRPIYEIAQEIKANWPNPGYAAPYLHALGSLNKITDKYGYDDGESIVLYFLSNASSWRGDVARRIKAELKGLCK